MKGWIAAVAVFCLLVPQVRAQDDAAKRAKVEELFTVMRLDHTMDRLMSSIRQQTTKMMNSLPGSEQMTPAQKRITEEFQNKVMTTALDSVGWKAMEPDMVNLYASTYSAQEIDGIIAFYKSPVGQSMLDKTPEITQKSLEITQQKAIALQPKLQGLMVEYRKEFEAAGPAKPRDAAPPSPAPSNPH